MILSIVTINYNNLKGLKNTVKSVQSQNFRQFEHIIIDGGSSDGSYEFIIRNKELFNFFISEKDSGIYNAMNKGIQYCSGDYIVFLNSGDVFFSSYTLLQINFDILDY